MKSPYHYLLLFAFLLVGMTTAQATHNRAGEIIIDQIGECSELKIRATVVTYTKASSLSADRDSLTICWGDGNCQTVLRNNGAGAILGNDIKKNLYIAEHTYPNIGTFVVSMTDPNRNAGILNVNYPQSELVEFHIQTTHTFLNCNNQGANSSPRLEQEPIDIGCVGQQFLHNPAAWDPDNDSLSYDLIFPQQGVNSPVPLYQYPNAIGNGFPSDFFINNSTGQITWNAPQQQGEYNMAMIIVSWRNGFPIDTIIRDMQVTIRDCQDNEPPTVETETYICVVAGETVTLPVIANDVDAGQKVKLTARGGPLELNLSPATFTDQNTYADPPVERIFEWNTTCEHIAEQPYQVVFKATDNYLDTTGLATLVTVRIQVVGPPPEDLQAEATSTMIDLSWDAPYICEDAEEDYFYTFTVWRKIGSNNFPIDTCVPGLEGQGYTKISNFSRELDDNGRYHLVDMDVERGRTYCYRVLAQFAKYTSTGTPFNTVESLPSEEICVQLSRDVPLLTHVDVNVTDNTNGEIIVRWTKPVPEDLDTILNPGPYRYLLKRAVGINGADFQDVTTFTADNFWQLNATEYTDNTGLNTVDNAYNYKIDFFVDGENTPIESVNEASSVYLTVAGADERNELSWDFDVPWLNTDYVIFKQNGMGIYELLDTVQVPQYTDNGLVNGREYCYYIESIGAYNVEGIPAPLNNRSQRACGIPVDIVPSCPPVLTVDNLCNRDENCIEAELENDLTWLNPAHICPESDDVVSYDIFYASTEEDEFTLIGSTDSSQDTLFSHIPNLGIAGCYAVVAIDSFDNRSDFSNIVCVDNCPIYNLPNAFTPNADGQNDQFVPYPYCFIDRIEFTVFNRWGEAVFTSTDPAINWDGNNMRGQMLPSGTYYFTCKVYEQRVSGITERAELLSGYIELINE